MNTGLIRTAFVFALSLLGLPQEGRAQCFTPDGLDGGPCCTAAGIKLPKFPPINGPSLQICWKDCDPGSIHSMNMWIAPPRTCGGFPSNELISRGRMTDSTGILWRAKRITMCYSRTWRETNSVTGTDYQVWRFLLNGDWRSTPGAGISGCVPPCGGQPDQSVVVRFTGYADWAYDCSTGKWSNAWMLTHACDGFDHVKGWPRGGGFHPDSSYTFVGPAASFTPDPNVPAPNGLGKTEAVRRAVPASIFTLPTKVVVPQYEETVQFQVNNISEACACDPSGKTPQFTVSDMAISGTCGTSAVSSTKFFNGYVSMGIGAFNDPATYPGLETLSWSVAELIYQDPCVSTNKREAFFGVSTQGGYKAQSIQTAGPPIGLPSTFIDMANSTRKGNLVLNEPFRSGHILNFNL